MMNTRKSRVILSLLAIAIASVLYNCGLGGGGGGGDGSPKIEFKSRDKFTIKSPVPGGATYQTTNFSVGLSGGGFIWPKNANCRDIQPQGYDITWRNRANGSSGNGNSSASCLCDLFGCIPTTQWGIAHGLIPLEIGSNRITVTGKAPGKSQSDNITVVREEGATSITFTITPGDMVKGNTYPLEVTVLDSMRVPVPDQVIDWNSTDESVTGLRPQDMPTDQQGKARADASARSQGTAEVIAVISGTDISSSVSLRVIEPPNEPLDPSLPTRPDLLTPINNSVVSQQVPPACDGRGGYQIFFDWTDARSPEGVVGYQLFVSRTGAALPLIDEFVDESEFLHLGCGSSIIDSNLSNWEWHVRARDSLGNYGPMSDIGVFQFAPLGG